MTYPKFAATPLDIFAPVFYFGDYAEYEEKAGVAKNAQGHPVEEFEIQYIDGPDAQLFSACGINQANLEQWFDEVEDLKEQEKAALFYLVEITGMDLNDALDKYEDVCLSECALKDAAEELFDDIYLEDIPDAVRAYIDYDAFARDCELGGDMCEFEFEGTTYTCTNANGL